MARKSWTAQFAAQIPITRGGFEINQPGRYVVVRNLVCAGTGIRITASHVHVNLADHTITGARADTAIDVSDASDVHVIGGTIQQFAVGVRLIRVTESSLSGVVVGDNVTDGILLEDSHRNHIKRNFIRGNGALGMHVIRSRNNGLSRNVVAQPQAGVSLEAATENTLTDNTIVASTGGVLVDTGSDGNILAGNIIAVAAVLANLGCATVHLGGSNGTCSHNIIGGNCEYGIRVMNGSTGYFIHDNSIVGNHSLADMADFNLPACVNTWQNNSFATDNESATAFGPGAGCIQ